MARVTIDASKLRSAIMEAKEAQSNRLGDWQKLVEENPDVRLTSDEQVQKEKTMHMMHTIQMLFCVASISAELGDGVVELDEDECVALVACQHGEPALSLIRT